MAELIISATKYTGDIIAQKLIGEKERYHALHRLKKLIKTKEKGKILAKPRWLYDQKL